jgi:hypothetical protein
MLVGLPFFLIGIIPWGCEGFPEAGAHWYVDWIAPMLFGSKFFTFACVAFAMNCTSSSMADQRYQN